MSECSISIHESRLFYPPELGRELKDLLENYPGYSDIRGAYEQGDPELYGLIKCRADLIDDPATRMKLEGILGWYRSESIGWTKRRPTQ